MPLTVSARSLKVTLVIQADEMASLAISDTARTVLTIKLPDRSVKADLATKSVRRAQTAISEHGPDGVALVLQGKLTAGDVLAEAGLSAQPKVRKPDAAAAA